MQRAIYWGEPPPLEYIEYLYQKKFKISYRDLLKEPADRILMYLKFSEIEARYKEKELKKINKYGQNKP